MEKMTLDDIKLDLKHELEGYENRVAEIMMKVFRKYRPALEAGMRVPLRFALDIDLDDRGGFILMDSSGARPLRSQRGFIAFYTTEEVQQFAKALGMTAVFVEADDENTINRRANRKETG